MSEKKRKKQEPVVVAESMRTFPSSCACCAVVEIDGIEEGDSPESILMRMKEDCTEGAFVFWTTTKGRRGSAMASYIKDHLLGTVTKFERRRNPNTGHYVTMWVWEVDQAAWNRWCENHITEWEERDAENYDGFYGW